MEFRVALKHGSGLLQPRTISARPQRSQSHVTASLSNGKSAHFHEDTKPTMPSIFACAWNGWLRWFLSESMLLRASVHHEGYFSISDALETSLRVQDLIWDKELAGQPKCPATCLASHCIQVLGCAGVREGLLKDKWAMITGKSSMVPSCAFVLLSCQHPDRNERIDCHHYWATAVILQKVQDDLQKLPNGCRTWKGYWQGDCDKICRGRGESGSGRSQGRCP